MYILYICNDKWAIQSILELNNKCWGHSTSISACGGQGLGFKFLGGSFTHIYT